MAEQPPAGGSTAPAPGTYPLPKPVEGRAIAALICGIAAPLGAFLLFGVSGVILGAVALGLGLSARSRIKRSGGVLGGGGMALAGWILGVVGLLIGLVWGVFLLGMYMAMTSGGGKGA